MKKKTLTVFGILIAIICIILRTVTLMYVTEGETGFFISRLIPMGIALCAATFILTLVASAFSFSSKQKAENCFTLSKKSGIFAIILGVSLLCYCLGFGTHPSAIQWQHTLEIVSGILSAVWFILYGMTSFATYKLPPVTAVIPVIHWLCRIIVMFSAFSTTSLVAEHIYTLCALCFTTLFMLQLGKTVSGIAGNKTLTAFFPTAICASILTLTSSVSRLIVTLLGEMEKIHGETPLDIVGITVGIFMLVITADISVKEKEKNSDEIQC
ncbi:MAG: hypothetical protein U0L72_06040 [Acutalibacteraceae bacterium]|nr:hypothetical protein [Acutalibacteraceae bacterium]